MLLDRVLAKRLCGLRSNRTARMRFRSV